MRPTTRLRLPAVLLSAALLASGCSAIADRAGEELVERAVEGATGGDVDIDTSDGSFDISGPDGENLSFQQAGDIPDRVAELILVPDGAEVLAVTEVTDGEDDGVGVVLGADGGDADALVAEIQAFAASLGVEATVSDLGGDGTLRILSYQTPEGLITSTVIDDGGTIQIQYLVNFGAEGADAPASEDAAPEEPATPAPSEDVKDEAPQPAPGAGSAQSPDAPFDVDLGPIEAGFSLAGDAYELRTRYLVECIDIQTQSSIWGTGIYTDDSAVCTAALHAGALQADSTVVVELVEGLDAYEPSTANGVESGSWGAWARSITFPAS